MAAEDFLMDALTLRLEIDRLTGMLDTVAELFKTSSVTERARQVLLDCVRGLAQIENYAIQEYRHG